MQWWQLNPYHERPWWTSPPTFTHKVHFGKYAVVSESAEQAWRQACYYAKIGYEVWIEEIKK